LASTCAPPTNRDFPRPALKTNKTRRKPRTLERSLAIRPTGKYVLRLFVAGATARSTQAVVRVRQWCATELQHECTLEVIDIYQQPALARKHQIVATPTLIKEFPPPIRRFIGSLLNIAGLFAELKFNDQTKIAV